MASKSRVKQFSNHPWPVTSFPDQIIIFLDLFIRFVNFCFISLFIFLFHIVAIYFYNGFIGTGVVFPRILRISISTHHVKRQPKIRHWSGYVSSISFLQNVSNAEAKSITKFFDGRLNFCQRRLLITEVKCRLEISTVQIDIVASMGPNCNEYYVLLFFFFFFRKCGVPSPPSLTERWHLPNGKAWICPSQGLGNNVITL